MVEKIEIDTQNHWVIWEIEAEQAQKDMLSWRMLEHNELAGILPFDYYYVDDRICFRYSYNSLQRMDDFFQKNMGDLEIISFVCEGILKVLEQGQEYLLNEKGYCILPEWIFWNRFEKKIGICYLPGREKPSKNEYTTLIEYLMEHTEHSDRRAVSFIYDLYDRITSEEFSVENLLRYAREKKGSVRKLVQKKAVAEEAWSGGCHFFLKPIKERLVGKLQEMVAKFQESVCYTIKQRELVVGRDRESDVYLPFSWISRRHAVFSYEDGDLYLTDTESKNGTWLNGKKISAYVKTKCQKGDVITFADISYRLEVSERQPDFPGIPS